MIVGAASEDVAIGEMLSENKHRQGLSDGELRNGARAMVEEFDHTPETGAEMVGVHPCTVRKWLRYGVRPKRAAIGPASDDPAAADSSVSPAAARRRPYSGTKYPRIRPTDVHELHQRWAERISGHLTPERAEQLLPQLLADVQELIGDWRPPAARQAAS